MCQMEEHFLHEYIDGTLLPLEKTILEEHLRNCCQCRQELNRLKVIDWDLRRSYQEDIRIPAELSCLRHNILEMCFSDQAGQELPGKAITSKEIWELQKATLNNSLKFLTLMSSQLRREKHPAPKPRKRASFFRKIFGL